MHPTDEERAVAYAVAVQVACANAVRGLAALEALENPEAAGVTVRIDADGGIDVEVLSRRGMPLSGYSL